MFAQSTMVALLASLVAAQHAPVGNPNGNPITRPLNEVVPACKPFTITWQPTTFNSVSLVLLRGPSTNVVPISTIISGIPNSGSFVWTPSSGLEADVTHYGLQLIDDVTGQFQYSTQFGISKGADCDGVAPSSAVSTPYGGGYPVSTPAASSKPLAASSSSSSAAPAVSILPVSSVNATTILTKPSSAIVATGSAVLNSTIVLPTKSMSVPSSLRPSATGAASATRSALPESTGAASSLHAGFGLVGAVAAFAFLM